MNERNQARRQRPFWVHLLEAMAIAVVYLLSIVISRWLARGLPISSPAWLTSGVSIAALSLFGWRRWYAITIGAILGFGILKMPIVTLLPIATGNTLEALAGAYIIRRLGRWRSQFDIQSDAMSIAIAAFAATAIGATFTTFTLKFLSHDDPAPFLNGWIYLWTGKALGAILLIPILLSIGDGRWRRQVDRAAIGRGCGVFLISALLLYLVFHKPASSTALSMVIFPSLLLGAHYLKPLGLRTLVIFIAIASTYATIKGYGPFSDDSSNDSRTYLQLFITAISITALFLEGFHRAGHYWMPNISLMVGWTMTAALFFSFTVSKQVSDITRFNSMVGDVTDRLTARMSLFEDALRAGVSFYRGSQVVEAVEWRNFVSSLGIGGNYGDIDGMGIILPVPLGQESRFKMTLANRGIQKFEFRSVVDNVNSVSNSSRRDIIVFAEPKARNGGAVGLDIASEPNRKAALDHAKETKRMTSTPGFKSLIEINDGPGFILYLPITPTNSKAPRPDDPVIGWAYVPVIAQKFFSGLRGRFWEEIEIYVFDSPEATIDSLLFRSDNTKEALPTFESITKVQLAQRNFYLGWVRGSGFVSAHNPSEAWVGFGGSILSLLFATMLVGLRETNQRATMIAREKTFLLTERERSLQQIREQFALAVKGSNDGLWDWNLVTNEVYYSPRWKEMLGYSDSELENVYSTWLDNVHPEDVNHALKTIDDYLQHRTSQHRCEQRMRHKDGSYRWILARGVALWDENGKPYRMAGSHTDITAIKQTQEKLIEAKESALAGARAKSEFLANMSHEIRTPLSGVIGVTALLEDTPLSHEQHEFVETIRQSSESLLSVINDILDFSKIEAGKLNLENVPFNLTEELKRIYHLMRFAAEKKKLRLVIDADPLVEKHLTGDPTRIRQVLVNLVSNAIKFSFKGEVKISVRATNSTSQKSIVRFSVKDEGIGIPEELHSQIFLPFSQADTSTSREFGGTGLGLSICKNLVELMNGEMGIESAIGAGSIFWFEIPLAHSKTVRTLQEESENLIEFRPLNAKILLAEDNAVSVKVATALLRKFGLTVKTVGSGREAINALSHEKFDLVLMDCQMPELDGYQATREIRASSEPSVRDVPIIAMTANSLKGDRERCLQAGMSDYLSKPVRSETLYAMLFKWTQSGPSSRVVSSETPTGEPVEVINLHTVEALASLSKPEEGDVLKRVADVYLEFYPKHFKSIQKHFADSNWHEMRREAHSLKAASGGLGLQIVAYVCQKIEDSTTTSSSEISPWIKRLEVELNRAVECLHDELTRLRPWA